jgi:putative membrane protein insertion efficiency factor
MKLLFTFYKAILSPLIHGFSRVLSGNPYSGCKFEPTCSCYCEQAILKYGLLRGLFKSVLRILRCHPFTRSGGYDPA